MKKILFIGVFIICCYAVSRAQTIIPATTTVYDFSKMKPGAYRIITTIDTTNILKDSLFIVRDTVCITPIPPIPPTTTTSVFTTQVPSGAAERDHTTGITVGMQFTTSAAGNITGVKFYKDSKNTGSHIGLLYNSSGTLLWSQPFTNETASGWQTVIFTTPVQVSAGNYVAACFSSAGWYSSNSTGFKTPITNGVLTGTKGVYKYATAPAFPSSTYQQSNYWVDAVFVNK